MATTSKTPAIDATVLCEPSGTPYGLRLAFAGGEQLEITAGQLSADIRAQALVHGLKQKLVDAAAIPRDTTTGRSATAQDKFEAVREVYERLLAGEWNKRREGGAGAGEGGLLFEAVCRLYEGRRTAEQVRAFLAGKTAAEQAVMRAMPKVAVLIAEIKAERARARVGAGGDEGLFDGLDDAE